MKKEDFGGLIVYLVIIILAIIFGLTVLQQHIDESTFNGVPYILYIMGSVLFGTLFNGILFELAHFVGAKVGGYDVISINILGLCFFKEDNQRKARFLPYDGLTGETKIVPKEGNVDKANPHPYLLFGSLFYAVEAIVVMIVFTMFANHDSNALKDVAYSVLIIGAIGFVVLLYNILPVRIDSITDGYRLTTVGNPKNKAAFNELLRVEHLINLGQKDVEIKVFDEITNFTTNLNLNKVYALLDKKAYAEAEVIIDKIIAAKNEIDEKIYIRARAQKIYIGLIDKDLESARAYYEAEVPLSDRREISRDISMTSIRAYLLMSGLLDKSRSECLIALNNVYRAFKHTPKTRQATEVILFNEALQKVIDAHPDWELEGYKLKVAN